MLTALRACVFLQRRTAPGFVGLHLLLLLCMRTWIHRRGWRRLGLPGRPPTGGPCGRLEGVFLLALFDGLEAVLCALLPLRFVQAFFLLAQAVEALACLPAYGAQAVFHRKTLLALCFFKCLLLRGSRALTGDARSFKLRRRVGLGVLGTGRVPKPQRNQAAG